jgi:hypothetical protein
MRRAPKAFAAAMVLRHSQAYILVKWDEMSDSQKSDGTCAEDRNVGQGSELGNVGYCVDRD